MILSKMPVSTRNCVKSTSPLQTSPILKPRRYSLHTIESIISQDMKNYKKKEQTKHRQPSKRIQEKTSQSNTTEHSNVNKKVHSSSSRRPSPGDKYCETVQCEHKVCKNTAKDNCVNEHKPETRKNSTKETRQTDSCQTNTQSLNKTSNDNTTTKDNFVNQHTPETTKETRPTDSCQTNKQILAKDNTTTTKTSNIAPNKPKNSVPTSTNQPNETSPSIGKHILPFNLIPVRRGSITEPLKPLNKSPHKTTLPHPEDVPFKKRKITTIELVNDEKPNLQTNTDATNKITATNLAKTDANFINSNSTIPHETRQKTENIEESHEHVDVNTANNDVKVINQNHTLIVKIYQEHRPNVEREVQKLHKNVDVTNKITASTSRSDQGNQNYNSSQEQCQNNYNIVQNTHKNVDVNNKLSAIVAKSNVNVKNQNNSPIIQPISQKQRQKIDNIIERNRRIWHKPHQHQLNNVTEDLEIKDDKTTVHKNKNKNFMIQDVPKEQHNHSYVKTNCDTKSPPIVDYYQRKLPINTSISRTTVENKNVQVSSQNNKAIIQPMSAEQKVESFLQKVTENHRAKLEKEGVNAERLNYNSQISPNQIKYSSNSDVVFKRPNEYIPHNMETGSFADNQLRQRQKIDTLKYNGIDTRQNQANNNFNTQSESMIIEYNVPKLQKDANKVVIEPIKIEYVIPKIAKTVENTPPSEVKCATRKISSSNTSDKKYRLQHMNSDNNVNEMWSRLEYHRPTSHQHNNIAYATSKHQYQNNERISYAPKEKFRESTVKNLLPNIATIDLTVNQDQRRSHVCKTSEEQKHGTHHDVLERRNNLNDNQYKTYKIFNMQHDPMRTEYRDYPEYAKASLNKPSSVPINHYLEARNSDNILHNPPGHNFIKEREQQYTSYNSTAHQPINSRPQEYLVPKFQQNNDVNISQPTSVIKTTRMNRMSPEYHNVTSPRHSPTSLNYNAGHSNLSMASVNHNKISNSMAVNHNMASMSHNMTASGQSDKMPSTNVTSSSYHVKSPTHDMASLSHKMLFPTSSNRIQDMASSSRNLLSPSQKEGSASREMSPNLNMASHKMMPTNRNVTAVNHQMMSPKMMTSTYNLTDHKPMSPNHNMASTSHKMLFENRNMASEKMPLINSNRRILSPSQNMANPSHQILSPNQNMTSSSHIMLVENPNMASLSDKMSLSNSSHKILSPSQNVANSSHQILSPNINMASSSHRMLVENPNMASLSDKIPLSNSSRRILSPSQNLASSSHQIPFANHNMASSSHKMVENPNMASLSDKIPLINSNRRILSPSQNMASSSHQILSPNHNMASSSHKTLSPVHNMTSACHKMPQKPVISHQILSPNQSMQSSANMPSHKMTSPTAAMMNYDENMHDDRMIVDTSNFHSSETLDIEQYVQEVKNLKDRVPPEFFGFYLFVSRKQIYYNKRPLSFNTFLELHNNRRLEQYYASYLVYVEKHKGETSPGPIYGPIA